MPYKLNFAPEPLEGEGVCGCFLPARPVGLADDFENMLLKLGKAIGVPQPVEQLLVLIFLLRIGGAEQGAELVGVVAQAAAEGEDRGFGVEAVDPQLAAALLAGLQMLPQIGDQDLCERRLLLGGDGKVIEDRGAVKQPARFVEADAAPADQPVSERFLKPLERLAAGILALVFLDLLLQKVGADGLVEGAFVLVILDQPLLAPGCKNHDAAAAPVFPGAGNQVAQDLPHAGEAEIAERFLRENNRGAELFRLHTGEDDIPEVLLKALGIVDKGLFHPDRADFAAAARIIPVHFGKAVPSELILGSVLRAVLLQKLLLAAREFLIIRSETEGVLGEAVVGLEIEDLRVVDGEDDPIKALLAQGAVKVGVLVDDLEGWEDKTVSGAGIEIIKAPVFMKL